MNRRKSLLENLKDWVYKRLLSNGFYVYSNRSLPFGVSLQLDIERLRTKEIEYIFDVGANIGQSVFRYGSFWQNVKIYSFEPVERTFRQLVENTREIPNVFCVNAALGASRSKEVIWLQNRTDSNSLNSWVNQKERSIGESQKINIITLDEFCLENKVDRIDFLKVDVEGYELEMLRGAERMLRSRAIQFILAETTFQLNDFQHTPITKLTEFLEPLSYRFIDIYNKMRDVNINRKPTHFRWCDALFKLQD